MNSINTKTFFSFSNRKDLTVVLKQEVSVSYYDLFNKAAQLSAGIKQEGIKEKDYIPLLISDNLKLIEITIALWMLGAIPVPLNTKLLDEEILSILDDHRFNYLVTDRKFSMIKNRANLNFISIDNIKPESEMINLESPSLNDEAVVIFTSGSTGRPKGVVHTFLSLISSIENGNDILGHKEKDRWLASLPFYHIGGFQIICRSLFFGCTIIIPETLQTNHLANAIVKNNPSHISVVSTQLERLLYQKIIPGKNLQVSLVGGGFISDDLMFEADKLGWKPYRVYGSSETASMITVIPADKITLKPESVGKPFHNVEIKVSKESEILIKSSSLFKKYLNDEKETCLRLVDNFYHTGDIGFIDVDGYLFIEARRNDLIVSGGENVNPIEVEKVLTELPFIIEVCVFPKQSKTWGQIVAAAIVSKDKSVDEKTLKEVLKQKLAGFKIPKQFFFLDELPKTSLGKLERGKIRKMF